MKLVALLAIAVAACAGVPRHDGYPVGVTQPWDNALVLQDHDGEIRVHDRVSYAERRRAVWFELQLPDGASRLELRVVDRRRVPLHLELLDPERHVILRDRAHRRHRASELSMTAFGLSAGRYLVHVYVGGRTDASDFVLEAKFIRGSRPTPSPGCVFVGAGDHRGAVEGGGGGSVPFRPDPEVFGCIGPLAALPAP